MSPCFYRWSAILIAAKYSDNCHGKHNLTHPPTTIVITRNGVLLFICVSHPNHSPNEIFRATMTLIYLTALGWVRQRSYELFLAVHMFFVAFLVLAVYHSYIVTPHGDIEEDSGRGIELLCYMLLPATLYLVDVVLRGVDLYTNKHVLVACTPATDSITKIEMLQIAGGSVPGKTGAVAASAMARRRDPAYQQIERGGDGNKFACEPGQFCYVNIGTISRFEWHPFTVSCKVGVGENATFHIKNMGDGTWTHKLHELASRVKDMEQTEAAMLPSIKIDGPYGHPPNFLQGRHSGIIYIAGGIGITPCAAQLDDLVSKIQGSTRANETKLTFDSTYDSEPSPSLAACGGVRHVTLVWVSREEGIFDAFGELLTKLNAANGSGLVSVDVKLFWTGTGSPTKADEKSEAVTLKGVDFEEYGAFAGDRNENRTAMAVERSRCMMPAIECGRPDLNAVIAGVVNDLILSRDQAGEEPSSTRSSIPTEACGVYVCGPSSLVKATEAACALVPGKISVLFDVHAEAFQL
jgi:predicted ferric reductase